MCRPAIAGNPIWDAARIKVNRHKGRGRMNISDLAEKIAAEHKLTKSGAKSVAESVLTAITEAAASGEEVSLNGFGKFKVQDRPAREGRNPQSGETMKIAASRKLTFAAAKAVKDALNAA